MRGSMRDIKNSPGDDEAGELAPLWERWTEGGSMGEGIESSEGDGEVERQREIPAEFVECAAKALQDKWEREAVEDGGDAEQYVPWDDIEDGDREHWREWVRLVLQTVLDATEATVEERPGGEGIERYHPPTRRIVTAWREVP